VRNRQTTIAALLGLSLLAACATPETAAPEPAIETPRPLAGNPAARLPAEIAGFRRERLAPDGAGWKADYALPARHAAAVVEVNPPLTPGRAGDTRAELDALLREQAGGAQGRATGRQFRETGRHRLPVTGGALDCAELSGSLGREPVTQLLCVGTAGDRVLRIRVTELAQGAGRADAVAFATGVARAARGG
jgi:hypothetical protein